MALRFRGLDAPVEVQYWKGGSPPVPDPNVQIAAQKGASRYNVSGPGGSSTWTQGPQAVMGYDEHGNPLMGTVDTQKTTLNPDEQKQYDTRNQIANTMLGGAASRVPGMAGSQYDSGSNFDYNAATPDAAKAAFTAQQEMFAPEFAKSNRTFEDKMANSGIPVGSGAYNDAMRQHENDQNFAVTQSAAGAQQQGANMAFQQHQANLNQGLQTRQQNYNELAAAMGSQQLAPVGSFASGGGGGVDASGAYNSANNAKLAPVGQFASGGGGGVDASGAFNAQNNAKLAGYNAGVAGDNANLSAGVGAAGSAAMIAAVVF